MKTTKYSALTLEQRMLEIATDIERNGHLLDDPEIDTPVGVALTGMAQHFTKRGMLAEAILTARVGYRLTPDDTKHALKAVNTFIDVTSSLRANAGVFAALDDRSHRDTVDNLCQAQMCSPPRSANRACIAFGAYCESLLGLQKVVLVCRVSEKYLADREMPERSHTMMRMLLKQCDKIS